MFRSRFNDAFPKSLPHLGPQDIERGVVESVPGEQVERLLCALLGLVLNRKKEVEWVVQRLHLRAFLLPPRLIWLTARSYAYILSRRGHFQRALEEAIQTHASQWPLAWKGKNPLHGGGSWLKMDPTERVRFQGLHSCCPQVLTNANLACPFESAHHMEPWFFRNGSGHYQGVI